MYCLETHIQGGKKHVFFGQHGLYLNIFRATNYEMQRKITKIICFLTF